MFDGHDRFVSGLVTGGQVGHAADRRTRAGRGVLQKSGALFVWQYQEVTDTIRGDQALRHRLDAPR